jgi:hypothetical protein
MGKHFEAYGHNDDVNIYECEVRLKFQIVEDKLFIHECDQSMLIASLVDAYSYGDDDHLEHLESHIDISEVQAIEASPEMRRQLIRLRNSSKFT